VARLDGGQVAFVRHALPGELVRAVVTERRRGYLRADAVEVLRASPDRVEPPCPYARPGRCGGCDFQHAAPAAQLELKAAVVRELLTRLGGLPAAEVEDLGVRVEPLPGGPLGWRTRVQYAVDAEGRPGFRKHRSHDIVPIDRCLIAHPRIQEAPVTDRTWRADGVEVVASSGGDLTIFTRRRGGRSPRVVAGPRLVHERAVGRDWKIDATGFWQVHPAAPDTLAAAVLELLQPRPGERAWDLYGGAGLFAAALAPASPPRAGTWPTCRRYTWRPATSQECWPATHGGGRSTWWCSTRRAPGSPRRSSTRSSPGGPVRSGTCPATRPRSPATSRCSGSAGGASPHCGRTTPTR
jgi:tRNA/tmRNA/rRNA uracil-C5-methylase (TrmA/RlmC/RlmD family)